MIWGDAAGTRARRVRSGLVLTVAALVLTTGCVATATLTHSGGPTPDPGAGRIVATVESSRVVVETFRADATPDSLPFNLIVAC